MALLFTFPRLAALPTDFNWEFLALGVPNKFAGLLFNVTGATGRLIHCPALLRAFPIALLDYGSVTLFHHSHQSLLLEGDLAGLLKVLLADLFLGRVKCGHVGVVTLFNILMGALEDGRLLDGLDLVLVKDAPQARLWVNFSGGEVDPTLHCSLSALSVAHNLRRMEICLGS